MSVFSEINRQFPVRNTPEEKETFRKYVLSAASEAGWNGGVEEADGHRNVILGNPETAKVIFTAHYDTPRTSLLPNLMIPCSRWLYWLYQIGIVILLLLIPSLAAAWAVFRLAALDFSRISDRFLLFGVYMIVYILLFLLFFKGRKNPHNANDNTSGVAGVLEIMHTLPSEWKDRVSLILFDDEEKGKKGSRAFAGRHEQIKKNTALINFDCIGYGDHFVLIRNRTCTVPEDPVREAFSAIPSVCFTDSSRAGANSDHLNFDQGMAVLACRESGHGILYADRIHTPRDTEVSENNLALLRDAAIRYIRELRP